MHSIRSAFFVSDRTGITAESLGHTLLTQFGDINFKRHTIPFVDTMEKAQQVSEQIRQTAEHDHLKPLIFMSIINPDVRNVFKVNNNAIIVDFFEAFIAPLELSLGQKASYSVGKAHGLVNEKQYDHRMEAVNFTLNHDDGIKIKDLDAAEIILVGVSRSGKTPTCLYLALQYGIRAANYPLTPEDLESPMLPKILLPFRQKIFGLTIDATRLHHIRSERKPDSKYASMENCKREIIEAESMFRYHGIPYLTTTHKSVEEIASNIMHKAGLKRRF